MKAHYLVAYLKERFPVINMALFAILFLTVYSVAVFFFSGSATPDFSWLEGWGMGASIFFFFRLRVFDEIKDYDLDTINHPHRVLQSGKINLQTLILLAVVGAVVELAWSFTMGWQTFICWLLVVGYSLLMRYEFFVSEFLKARLVLYAISHMLIMPLVILWVWSAYAPDALFTTPYYLLAMLSLLGGFSFELARKIHAPEAERELVDSYSKSIGFKGAIGAVLLVVLAGVMVQAYLLTLLQSRQWPFYVLGLLYMATFALYFLAMKSPKEKMLRIAEILVSLFMLVSYLSVIMEVHF